MNTPDPCDRFQLFIGHRLRVNHASNRFHEHSDLVSDIMQTLADAAAITLLAARRTPAADTGTLRALERIRALAEQAFRHAERLADNR